MFIQLEYWILIHLKSERIIASLLRLNSTRFTRIEIICSQTQYVSGQEYVFIHIEYFSACVIGIELRGGTCDRTFTSSSCSQIIPPRYPTQRKPRHRYQLPTHFSNVLDHTSQSNLRQYGIAYRLPVLPACRSELSKNEI